MTPQGQFWISNSSTTREKFLAFAQKLMEEQPYVVWEWFLGKPITGKQNAALHVYFRLLSKELNANGLTVETFFKDGYEVPFSEEIVKEHIWRPIQIAVTEKESSQELTTIETQQIYENVNRALANRSIHVPWPEQKK